MAQIYEQQVMEKTAPTPPDISEMKAFDVQRKEALGKMDAIMEHSLKIQEERKKQERDTLTDQTKRAAEQVYKNAYTRYPNDPKKYKEEVNKGLKTIYDPIPDSGFKNDIMGDVAITGSGYDAKVDKGFSDKRDRINKFTGKDYYLGVLDMAKANLSVGVFTEGDVNKYTPEQIAERDQAADDINIKLGQAYRMRNKTDLNGNPWFSTAERETITDMYENQGYYAAVDYVFDNVATDYRSAVALRDRIVNDREWAMSMGINDETYEKTISECNRILSGQITSEQAKDNRLAQIVNESDYKDMGIEITEDMGIEMNDKYKNLDHLVSKMDQFDASVEAGVYGDPRDKSTRAKIDKMQIGLNLAFVDSIEEGAGVKGQRWKLFQKFNWGKANTGETALMQVNQNIESIVETMGIDEDTAEGKEQIIDMKAQMYRHTLGQLQTSGKSLTAKNDSQGLEYAKKFANKGYIDYVQKLTNGKVQIAEKDKDNPSAIRVSIKQAMIDQNQEDALAAKQKAYRSI